MADDATDPDRRRRTRSGRRRRDLDDPGFRPTQLPPDMAMRAREAFRPTDAELAEADRDIVIVRRNYIPAEPLPHAPRRSGSRRR